MFLPASTTAVGRAFELHALKFLNHHLHMALRPVGGAGDEGIDLRGWWYVPAGARRSLPEAPVTMKGWDKSAVRAWDNEMKGLKQLAGWGGTGSNQYDPDSGFNRTESTKFERPAEDGEGEARRLRVLVQCKAEKNPLNTRPLREMEGVMAHFHGRDMQLGPHQYDLSGRRRDRSPPTTVGIVVSQSGFSPRATTRAWRSPSPLVLVHLPGGRKLLPSVEMDGEGETGEGMKVVGCWWNPSLSGLRGLLGGTMELKQEILRQVAKADVADAADGEEETGTPESRVVTQWRPYYLGKRMERQGPSLQEALVSLGGKQSTYI